MEKLDSLKKGELTKDEYEAWLEKHNVRVVDRSVKLYGREDEIRTLAELRKKVQSFEGPEHELESWIDDDISLKKAQLHGSKQEEAVLNKISKRLYHQAGASFYKLPKEAIFMVFIWATII